MCTFEKMVKKQEEIEMLKRKLKDIESNKTFIVDNTENATIEFNTLNEAKIYANLHNLKTIREINTLSIIKHTHKEDVSFDFIDADLKNYTRKKLRHE